MGLKPTPTKMDSTALALTLAGFGVLLIAISYARYRHRRDVSALLHGAAGAILFLCGSLLFALALNFNTYAALHSNEPLAEVSIEKSANNRFQLRLLRIPAGDLQVFSVQGDRWEIHARVLHWHGWAEWLGLRENIRLEQLNSLSTRKTGAGATSGYVNSFSLSRNPGIDIWALRARYPLRLAALDASLLQTVGFPLQDGLRFHLYWQNGEFIARQINTPGRRATGSITVPAVELPDFMNELDRQSSSTESTEADVTAQEVSEAGTAAPTETSNDPLGKPVDRPATSPGSAAAPAPPASAPP